MEQCFQTEDQNMYQHGLSVRNHLKQIIDYLYNDDDLSNWKIPIWLKDNKKLLIDNLLSWEVLENYTIYHDCGKFYCREIDELGKQHFPNHAQISERIWLQYSSDKQVGKLIGMDMDIHYLKNKDVKEFAQRKEAISLLLTGLSEIHANSKLFGGIESVSFKIKYKQIDKRGAAIIKEFK